MKWHKPDYFSDYCNSVCANKDIEWDLVRQIGYCQAWIVRDKTNGRVCLQSYSTIVSYVTVDGVPVRLGKWTTTTSKHQTLFERLVSSRPDILAKE